MPVHRPIRFSLVLLLGFFLSSAGCITPTPDETPIRKLTFLLTNDIHGHLDPHTKENGASYGGMAHWSGVVNQIRNEDDIHSGKSALFVLDSGDQFQGTLLSNFDEGESIFKSMDEIGYDAMVPGNHDYDFGPMGWLYDRVTSGKTGINPREVIERLASQVRFPLLSANTYLKSSISTSGGKISVELDSQCRSKNETLKDGLDFENAKRPDFLKPYVILKKAGVRVALIGIDHHATANTTTLENVADLCFRDERETYLELRRLLEGQADVFVMMIHNGNSSNSSEASELTRSINTAIPNGVHLVAAGHTHFIHDESVEGVRVIQNGAGNRNYGRVDLYFDSGTQTLIPSVTTSKSGIEIPPLNPNPTVEAIVQKARFAVSSLAKKKLGHATEEIERNRISESPLSNLLTDLLRSAARTQIALMNTGGIRANLKKGEILYEDFFEVLPFSNQAVIMNSVPWKVLRQVLSKSIQTCGKFGALMQSGLKVTFKRNCKPDSDLDLNAILIRVEDLGGRVLLDRNQGIEADAQETFSVATLDFLASGGSGYPEFREAQVSEILGIARELMVNELEKTKPEFSNRRDDRFKALSY